MSDCIFCKIANHEIPCDLAYEDEKIMIFKDINPVTPIHLLAIPKKHIESILCINDNNSSIINHIFETIPKIAEQTGIADTGFRVTTNIGKDSGQLVPHLHFHVIGGRKLHDILG